MVGARPLALPGGGLQERHDTFGPAAVTAVVVAAGIPAATAASTNSCAPAITGERTETPSGPVGAVRVGVDHDVAARSEALALLEVRQHVGVAPAGGARRGPRIEVARVTANVCHVVDARADRRASAPRHHHAPVGRGRGRLCRHRPCTSSRSRDRAEAWRPPPASTRRPEANRLPRPAQPWLTDLRTAVTAMTAPADPPPTTTKSKASAAIPVPLFSPPPRALRRSLAQAPEDPLCPQPLMSCVTQGMVTPLMTTGPSV